MTSDPNSAKTPAQPQSQRGGGGLSLYANLLDPTAAGSGATISRDPVSFASSSGDGKSNSQGQSHFQQQQDNPGRKPVNAAALRFQPTKRPVIASQRGGLKAKALISKPPVLNNTANASSSDADVTKTAQDPTQSQVQGATGAGGPTTGMSGLGVQSTLADWTGADDEDLEYYGGGAGGMEKRQRGGRKKRKKNREQDHEAGAMAQNWDDIYDPSRPNVYEEYKHSEEKYREIREWKDRLYAHKLRHRAKGGAAAGRDAAGMIGATGLGRGRGQYSSDGEMSEEETDRRENRFAPPSSYSFAPPTSFDTDNDAGNTAAAAPPPPPENVPDDATGEDAYARRMRLSQAASSATASFTAPPPPPPEPPSAQGTISRAPVRYTLPSAPADIPATEAELEEALASDSLDANAAEDTAGQDGPGHGGEPDGEGGGEGERSLRPGQKGFAQRLMAKYGWTKGSGLGAAGTGIVNPLRVQVEKRKKRSDAEGGGWVGGPGGGGSRGKIIGSKHGKATNSVGKEAEEVGEEEVEEEQVRLSPVVVLQGMLRGMDVEAELRAGDGGGIMQEIGEECAEKYGRVERVYIHRHTGAGGAGAAAVAAVENKEEGARDAGDGDEGEDGGAAVFVKFTSTLSALRAVQALHGRLFNGNRIEAGYWDEERFERGEYE